VAIGSNLLAKKQLEKEIDFYLKIYRQAHPGYRRKKQREKEFD